MERATRVFISSTTEELKAYREAAESAVRRVWHDAELFEDWPASADWPLGKCLERVDGADLLIAIVAHRYGWVPAGEEKSITRLECERARDGGIDIIPFLATESPAWDGEFYESHRLTEAARSPVADPQKLQSLSMEVATNTLRLNEFKEWIRGIGICATFDSPDGLGNEIERALMARMREGQGASRNDTLRTDYLRWLNQRHGSVELLGLDPENPHNARLDHVYVPAVIAPHPAETESNGTLREMRLPEPLLHRIGEASLYLSGAPGSGKSTFCRWLALVLAGGSVPQHPIPVPEAYRERLGDALVGKLPLLCPLRELAGEVECLKGNGLWSRKQLERALACWIDAKAHGGLTGAWLLGELKSGRVVVILDGVDELPERLGETRPRANLLSGLADALTVWEGAGNRVLLTSRPYGLSSEDRRRVGLSETRLEGMPPELQRCFIRRWYAAVDPEHQGEKSDGLVAHLDSRPNLDELRPNPMLLTALCVKYDDGQRLPQDIFDLYDAVVRQVLHKRYGVDQERDRARRRLATVALGMHTGEFAAEPRSTPAAAAGFLELERILTDYARSDPTSERGECEAHERLDDLLSQSGLLLPTGDERAGFYHLSFQEFLAATRLMKLHFDRLLVPDLQEFVAGKAKIPEWRNTLTFLFCAVDALSPDGVWSHFAPLLEGLAPEALTANPASTLLLADCLEVAHARGRCIDVPLRDFRRICDHALERVEPSARNHLWKVLGRMGLDDRPGVGVVRGGPDIEWRAVPGADFVIARYPVTNAQFQAFIDAPEGCRNDAWWEGLAERSEAPLPPYWGESNRPRVLVSWYEAIAFCRWLSACRGEEVRLPTEAEWELAATGGGGREFPWDGGFQSGRANINETDEEAGPYYLAESSVVGLYPMGASPCGADDMAGNVWEWCLNEYDAPERVGTEGDARRGLRGGSWFGHREWARCAARAGGCPGNCNANIGFRVLCVSPIVSGD